MSKKVDLLLDAVMRGDIEGVKSLVKSTNSLNSVDRAGRTALINSVLNEDIACAKILIEAGANVDVQDLRGCSALHYAAQNYSIDFVDLLIKSNAFVDAKDDFGNTPLFKAVFESRGRPDVVKALLLAGANQDSVNNSGVSPKILAKTIANFDVASLLSG